MDNHNLTLNNLIKNNKNCNLATSSLNGTPEVSTIRYYSDEENNFYFKTFNDSKKYLNLLENSKASLTVYKKPDYVQIDGTIKIISKSDEDGIRQKFIEKFGEDEYYSDSRLRFLKFKPNWIRIRLDGNYPPKFKILLNNK